MSDVDLKPLDRFSDRVADYVRYRPGYPASLIAALRANAGLGTGVAVADIASGTGIFTRLLLEEGALVVGVEPNDPMRAAAETLLAGYAGFTSVKGTAESTGLAGGSVSLITCAQAFHWVKPAPARIEFMRILKPGGACALIWNHPQFEPGDFGSAYEEIKAAFGTDFGSVREASERATSDFDAFFGNSRWTRSEFPNFQDFDLQGLKGRFNSSSYAPRPGDPGHAEAMAALEAAFRKFGATGTVRMVYRTELTLGHFTAATAVGA